MLTTESKVSLTTARASDGAMWTTYRDPDHVLAKIAFAAPDRIDSLMRRNLTITQARAARGGAVFHDGMEDVHIPPAFIEQVGRKWNFNPIDPAIPNPGFRNKSHARRRQCKPWDNESWKEISKESPGCHCK